MPLNRIRHPNAVVKIIRPTIALLSLVFTLAGCSDNNGRSVANKTHSNSSVVAERAVATAAALTETEARLWARSCALCHVEGNADAPRIGNQAEWAQRLNQPMELLLEHTIEGFNAMPPLGYCMACERENLVAMIRFMTQGVTPASAAEKQTEQAK